MQCTVDSRKAAMSTTVQPLTHAACIMRPLFLRVKVLHLGLGVPQVCVNKSIKGVVLLLSDLVEVDPTTLKTCNC